MPLVCAVAFHSQRALCVDVGFDFGGYASVVSSDPEMPRSCSPDTGEHLALSAGTLLVFSLLPALP